VDAADLGVCWMSKADCITCSLAGPSADAAAADCDEPL